MPGHSIAMWLFNALTKYYDHTHWLKFAVNVSGKCRRSGIIITASHNPREWNALKAAQQACEFINAEEGSERDIELAENVDFIFATG